MVHALQRVAGDYRLVEPKTVTARRSLPLPPPAVAALREQQQALRRAAGPR